MNTGGYRTVEAGLDWSGIRYHFNTNGDPIPNPANYLTYMNYQDLSFTLIGSEITMQKCFHTFEYSGWRSTVLNYKTINLAERDSISEIRLWVKSQVPTK